VSRVTRKASSPTPRTSALIAWLVGVEALGAVSALLAPRGAWYETLVIPSWAAAGWVHSLGLAIAGACIAVAAGMVWPAAPPGRRRAVAVALFLILGLGFFWPPLLYGARRLDLAMLALSALWVAIVRATGIFHRIRPLAGWLLAPPLLWTTYAAASTLAIWLRNG
jgi:tryptophan-rich sensory protein